MLFFVNGNIYNWRELTHDMNLWKLDSLSNLGFCSLMHTQWRKSCSTFYYWFKTGSFSTNTEEDVSVYGLNLSTVELVAQFSPHFFFLLTTQFMIRLLASAWYMLAAIKTKKGNFHTESGERFYASKHTCFSHNNKK